LRRCTDQCCLVCMSAASVVHSVVHCAGAERCQNHEQPQPSAWLPALVLDSRKYCGELPSVGLDDVSLLHAKSAANVQRVFTLATREEGQAGSGGALKHKDAALGRAGALMGRGCAQASGLPSWVTQALIKTVWSPKRRIGLPKCQHPLQPAHHADAASQRRRDSPRCLHGSMQRKQT
jgi:hypothetical protein